MSGRHRNSRNPESPGWEGQNTPTVAPILIPSPHMYSAPGRATSSCRYTNTGGNQAHPMRYSRQSRFRGVRRFVYRSCLRATLTRSSRRSRPDDLPPYRPIPPPPTRPSSHSTSRRHRTISDRMSRRIRRRPTSRHRNRLCRKQPTTLVRSTRRMRLYRAIICRHRSRPSYSP